MAFVQVATAIALAGKIVMVTVIHGATGGQLMGLGDCTLEDSETMRQLLLLMLLDRDLLRLLPVLNQDFSSRKSWASMPAIKSLSVEGETTA